ncbi:MAG: cell division protein FtsL [Armatimonadota bacterium]|nr:cell division protein FtsL [Armatimonadota bacterium]MDR7455059.1 cell division protein FtsL [Armatimonadota bacterium]MDR7456897.1 cell division protein FtsL [Armatimonadota bacterium]MDR7495628.1 cell division protein FtsL [Armatimonadota bacterium]
MIAPRPRARFYPVWLPDGAARRQPVVRRRPRLHPMVGATVMAVLLTLPAVLYVSVRAYSAEAGYTILRLQHDLARLRAEHARLSLQVAALKAPQRIERYATKELGMAPPRQSQLATITVGPSIARVEVPAGGGGVFRTVVGWFGGGEAEARERPR